MKKYQARVIQEKKELDAKRKKLNLFIASDHDLLTTQRRVMGRLSAILELRIARFQP